MASESVIVPPSEAAAPLNFIYSCSVCCYTLADVYEGRVETVKGLSDGINSKERLVTHLYLASCCHVFCGSHLDGGAPPFHPDGQRPKAPCPTCLKEKGDGELRDLYSIRGFGKDEHDPIIPPAWFIAPPASFDGSGKEIEALRFQYLALVRYCQNVHTMRKPLQDALAEVEKRLASVQDFASEEHAKVVVLQEENKKLQATGPISDEMKTEIKRLQDVEQEVEQYRRLNVNPKDLETFKNNKDAIRHYLKLVPMLIEQNDKMQKRLASLGFAMALEPIPNLKGFDLNAIDDDGGININCYKTPGTSLRKSASSYSAHKLAHTSGDPLTAPPSPFMQRPSKRRRVDSPLPNNMQVESHTTRDAMPPPQKPVSKMRSMRKIFPTLRRKFTGERSIIEKDAHHSNSDDTRMYDAEGLNNATYRSVDHSSHLGHEQSHESEDSQSETAYMSGALPVEQPCQSGRSAGPQFLSDVGVNEDKPDFTFRAASPVQMSGWSNSHHPVQLPNEPSYIRLMDGLSRDNGVELGLKDPRDGAANTYQLVADNREVTPYDEGRRQREGSNDQNNWSTGHPSLYQLQDERSYSTGRHSNPGQRNQINRYGRRALQTSSMAPETPAPRRHQHAGDQIESVVSPNVEISNHNTSPFVKSRIAEPQGSSNHFVAYQSPRFRMAEHEPTWQDRSRLNGLSFFESPVVSRTQAVPRYASQQIDRPPRSRHSQNRNLNSSGFITRPDVGRSPFFSDGAFGSARDKLTYAKRQHTHKSSAIHCPSFGRSSHAHTGQVPSAMPSIVSGWSPVRKKSQWEGLQRMGVRSSRHEFGGIEGNTYASSSRKSTFSGVRRRIRR